MSASVLGATRAAFLAFRSLVLVGSLATGDSRMWGGNATSSSARRCRKCACRSRCLRGHTVSYRQTREQGRTQQVIDIHVRGTR